MDKLCVVCKHFDIDPGFCGSEVTGSEPAAIECRKLVWFPHSLSSFGDNAEFRALIRTAERCPHFEPAK